MAQIYTLSPAEDEILQLGTEDPNIVLGYFFSHPGRPNGFQLDYNFTEEGKWQKAVCTARQPFIIIIAGVGTGKTVGVGVGGFCSHALVTPGFKGMNVAKDLSQSKMMYDEILAFAKGTPFENLIVNSPSVPFPKITIEFYRSDGITLHTAELQFRSLGENADASNILSYRGDWLNIEQAERIDNLGEITRKLVTRGTGSTPDGRPYLGRLSIIANVDENPELWQLFDAAAADPEWGLVFNIETKDNKNVTEEQVRNQIRIAQEVAPDDIDRFLTGKRPEGKGLYFDKESVAWCTSELLSERLKEGLDNKIPGFIHFSTPSLKTWHFEFPAYKDKSYVITADPGTGNPPLRNAPCILVFDVTETNVAPGVAYLVGMWWGFGGGSIKPFTKKFIEMIDKYDPLYAAIDNTGPQKGYAELLTEDHITEKANTLTGKARNINEITGMDFSGSGKSRLLISLKLSLSAVRLAWPSVATAIGIQLRNYDNTLDKAQGSKLAQDIVSAMAMASFLIKSEIGFFAKPNEDNSGKTTTIEKQNVINIRGRNSREANIPRDSRRYLPGER